MAKATTIKDALRNWEETHKIPLSEAKVVELQFQWGPIEKMDSNLGSNLVNCEKLSLSSNMIEKIGGLSGMKNLKILALGRNYIKTLSGIILNKIAMDPKVDIRQSFNKGVGNLEMSSDQLFGYFMSKQPQNLQFTMESVAETLEELWLSYNFIEKTKGIGVLSKLKVFYLNHNMVKDWAEFVRLQECTQLEEVSFLGNPINDKMEEEEWRAQAIRRLPQLKKLDGDPVISEV